jgi:hypothetical protein
MFLFSWKYILIFGFFVCEGSRQFQEDALVPQPRLGEAPSSRDGKHTLMHITYRLYESGWKLAIMIQIIGNLMLVHPSVVVNAHVFRLNLIRIQSPQYVRVILPRLICDLCIAAYKGVVEQESRSTGRGRGPAGGRKKKPDPSPN